MQDVSGDFGWNEIDESGVGVISSALLLVTAGAYFGATWLLSGLAPLSMLVSRCDRSSKSA